MRLRHLCVASLVLLATASAAASTASRAGDGKLLLKNDHVTITIDPVQGGAVTSMKAGGRELLAKPSFVDANILVWRRQESLDKVAFDVAEPAQADGRAAWSLSCMLPEDQVVDAANLVGRAWDAITWRPKDSLVDHPYEHVRLTKTYSLGADSGGLTVAYALTNTGKEAVPVCLATTVSPAGVRCSFPTMHGALTTDVGPAKQRLAAQILNGRKRGFLYDVPGAAFGGLDAKGNGLAVGFDPRHVSFVDIDAAAGRMGVARTRITLKPGETFRTTAWALPVSGMAQVAGVQDGLAGSFGVTPKEADGAPSLLRKSYTAEMLKKVKIDPAAKTGMPDANDDMADLLGALGEKTVASDGGYAGKRIAVTLTLTSDRTRKVEVVFTGRAAREAEAHPLGTKSVSLRAGRATPVQVSFQPKRAGTYAVAAEVKDGQATVARFEHPIVAGEPAGFFLPTVPKREGEVNTDYFYAHGWGPRQPLRPDWQPTTKHPTPHLTFGKPLAGGPIKALWHTPYARARDVVEVAGRIDMDHDVVITQVWDWTQEETNLATLPEIDRMRVALNKPHEVIILTLCMGKRLPMDVTEEIVRQVEKGGVGLIVHSPQHLAGPLEGWLKQAEVLPALSRDPSIRVHEPGRGRVVFAGGGREAREPILRVVNTHESYYLSEGDYSRFAHLMQWAARREGKAALAVEGPRATVLREKQAVEPLRAIIAAGREGFKGTVRVVFRKDLLTEYWYHIQCYQDRRLYASWEDLAEVTRAVDVRAGQKATLTVPLPALPTGPCVADVSLLDAEGKVHDWRRFPFTLGAKAYISRIAVASPSEGTRTVVFEADVDADIKKARAEFEQRFWQADQDETVRIAVTAVDAPAGTQIDVRCFDPWGRVAVDQRRPLKEGHVEFEASLHNAAHRVLEMNVRLMDGETCLQQRRLMGFIEPRRNRWHAFHWITYSPDSDLRPEVTGYDSRHRGFVGVRDIVMHVWCNMHMTGLFGGMPMAQDILVPGKQPKAAPDAPPVPGAPAVTKQDVAELFKEDEVATEKGWIRVPCLQNPEFRKKQYDHHRDYFATRSRLSRPFNATMGDEFFYTKEFVDHKVPAGFRRQFILCRDGNICRCEHCLKAFTDYCRTQYGGDLARLNAEWSTDVKTWEEVDPPILSKSIIRVAKTFEPLAKPHTGQYFGSLTHCFIAA